jgi:hypothetical protein
LLDAVIHFLVGCYLINLQTFVENKRKEDVVNLDEEVESSSDEECIDLSLVLCRVVVHTNQMKKLLIRCIFQTMQSC